MKIVKAQALLYIYDKLLTEGSFNKTEVMEELELSNLTFARYISEISAFLFNSGSGKELIYNKRKDVYEFADVSKYFDL